MIKFFKQNYKNSNGFTLVETLVAVAIFSVALVALLTSLGRGIADISYAKNKTTAEYLAQEGIEYIRNMRDTYVLYSATAQTGWNTFNTNITKAGVLCQNADGCYFGDLNFTSSSAITNIPMAFCPSGVCPALRYDTNSGKYNYSSGLNSIFSRKIKITQTNTNELKILSTVSWTQGSGSKSTTLSESLFNWVE